VLLPNSSLQLTRSLPRCARAPGHGYVSALETELMTLDRRTGADLLKTGLLGGLGLARLGAYIWGGVFLIFSCRSESPPAASDAPSSVPPDEKDPLQTTSPRAGVSAEHPADASLIELISSPERFRGLWVRVVGYVVLVTQSTCTRRTSFVASCAMPSGSRWTRTGHLLWRVPDMRSSKDALQRMCMGTWGCSQAPSRR
jgi:hypothetical protein